MITLFKKEFRQHGAFAPAMVVLCLCLQIAYYEGEWFFKYQITNEAFFAIAILVAALYAGAAAALAYSTEHAENTFIFLRKLPISLATLAAGKIGWALCGSLLVILGNLLLAAACTSGQLDGRTGLAYGFGIVEAFVWGLFWSTRCRSQIHALLATYLCAAGSIALLGNIFHPSNPNVIDVYVAILPHRAIVTVFVGLFAVWGAFRWYHYESAKPLLLRLFPDHNPLFRYPKFVQPPFLALVHQHIRHTSLIYPFGILCFIVFALGCLFICVLPDAQSCREVCNQWWWVTGTLICAGGAVLFWGNIFGHDQRNDSYRYLSRLGIPDGTIWWSRILPALFFYVSALVCFLGMFLLTEGRTREYEWESILIGVSAMCAAWLIPMAVGAFLSISLRSQMVAIALTTAGIFFPYIWMYFGWMFFGCSPLWTTIPLCLALLLASRLRAGYWLRETYTWRSRLIPLVSVFGVMIVVLAAIPFVRVYSIPYVSWEQIDACFDRAYMGNIPRAPEKRKALIAYIAKHNDVPPEYRIIYGKLRRNQVDAKACSYEEYLLLRYFEMSEQLKNSYRTTMTRDNWQREDFVPYMPWESVRADRALRLLLIAFLAHKQYIRDNDAQAIQKWCDRQERLFCFLDGYMWGNTYGGGALNDNNLCSMTLEKVFVEVSRWYREHDNTLPESLDAMVGVGTPPYFTELPCHTFTGEPVQYFRNAMLALTNITHHSRIRFLDDVSGGWQTQTEQENKVREDFKKNGGTYLHLGGRYLLIAEPSDEASLPFEP